MYADRPSHGEAAAWWLTRMPAMIGNESLVTRLATLSTAAEPAKLRADSRHERIIARLMPVPITPPKGSRLAALLPARLSAIARRWVRPGMLATIAIV
ncbi:MAG: hypothetical protein JWM76_2953 [Pseudonocardiales bacterium]|nr:hypothetical protein [Pseudonocardiales bacterium]